MRARWLLVATTAIVVSGCFFPFTGLNGFSTNNQDPFPTVLAEYSTGSAQAVITQDGATQTITFDHLGRGSNLNSIAGAGVTWKTDDGWVLQVTAYDFSALLEPQSSAPQRSGSPAATATSNSESYTGEVTLDRIHDNEFWTAGTYTDAGNRCIVDITEVSESVVSGSATCRGLRWTDGTASPFGAALDPVLIEGQAPFDADITFEARP